MHTTELIIGDHSYMLPQGADESEVLARLTDAVRAGGGVVELPAVSSTTRAVLISPGVPVFIERIPIPEAAGRDFDAVGDAPPANEWDDY